MLKEGEIIQSGPYAGVEVIDVYSRADALADGVLIDVSIVAQEAGIRFPVAVTNTVWGKYVEVPEGVQCQNEQGRLWDIVWMLRHAIKGAKPEEREIRYQLYVRNDNRRPKLVTLKAVCGPGDNMEPVITVMLPEED